MINFSLAADVDRQHGAAIGTHMIKNFDEVKKQLGELAGVINAFKSEAVQLRIIELVLRSGGGEDHGPTVAETEVPKEDESSRVPGRRRRRAKPGGSTEAESAESPARKRARKANGSGPMPTLEILIGEDFFKKRQTIGQIVEHSQSSKARLFKPNEISGSLGRLVRSGKLKREKNADGQFEYFV